MKTKPLLMDLTRFANMNFGGNRDKATAWLISDDRALERRKVYEAGGKRAHLEGKV